MKKTFLVVLTTLILSGCLNTNQVTQYTINLATLTTSLQQLDVDYDAIKQNVMTIKQLTVDERQVAEVAFDELDKYREIVTNITEQEGLGQVIVSLDQVSMGYDSAKLWYLTIKDIVVAHKAELDPVLRIKLRKADMQAARFDAAYTQLTSMPPGSEVDVTALVRDAMSIAAAGIKVAAIL